jgi:hypothetical protein
MCSSCSAPRPSPCSKTKTKTKTSPRKRTCCPAASSTATRSSRCTSSARGLRPPLADTRRTGPASCTTPARSAPTTWPTERTRRSSPSPVLLQRSSSRPLLRPRQYLRLVEDLGFREGGGEVGRRRGRRVAGTEQRTGGLAQSSFEGNFRVRSARCYTRTGSCSRKRGEGWNLWRLLTRSNVMVHLENAGISGSNNTPPTLQACVESFEKEMLLIWYRMKIIWLILLEYRYARYNSKAM